MCPNPSEIRGKPVFFPIAVPGRLKATPAALLLGRFSLLARLLGAAGSGFVEGALRLRR